MDGIAIVRYSDRDQKKLDQLLKRLGGKIEDNISKGPIDILFIEVPKGKKKEVEKFANSHKDFDIDK